jgi:hypothetical protein
MFNPQAYRAVYYALPREQRAEFAKAFKAAHRREINEYRKANPLRPQRQRRAAGEVQQQQQSALVIDLSAFLRYRPSIATTPQERSLAAAA